MTLALAASQANQVLITKAGISAQDMFDNILAAWARADETTREDGARWYLLNGQAVDDLAAIHGLSSEHVAAVVAHLSPRIHWARCLVQSAALLAGKPTTGIMSRSVNGALNALHSDEPLFTLKGHKTRNFALNLLGDDQAVTIDVWALRIAMGDVIHKDKVLERAGVYEAIAEIYREAAAYVGVSPSTMQATTWIVARNGRAN